MSKNTDGWKGGTRSVSGLHTPMMVYCRGCKKPVNVKKDAYLSDIESRERPGTWLRHKGCGGTIDWLGTAPLGI